MIGSSDVADITSFDVPLDYSFGELPTDMAGAIDVSDVRMAEDTDIDQETMVVPDLEQLDYGRVEPEDTLYPEAVTPPDVFTECEGLDVFPAWSGTFEGMIMFNIEISIPGVPQQGVLLVYGDLEFEIKCLEEKLIVLGTLEGVGEAEGEAGLFPYTATIGGMYNPITQTVDAQMVDGVVVMYGLLQVYFEGNFTGELVDEYNFSGTWDGEEAGNNLGIPGEASGQGTWSAEPVL